MNVKDLYRLFQKTKGIVIDTRKPVENSLFVSLYKQPIINIDKKIIKIVDFNKEKKLRDEGMQKKIKVKYF